MIIFQNKKSGGNFTGKPGHWVAADGRGFANQSLEEGSACMGKAAPQGEWWAWQGDS